MTATASRPRLRLPATPGSFGERPIPEANEPERLSAHRLLSLLALLSLFGIAFSAWGTPVQVPLTGILVATIYGVGLTVGVGIISTQDVRTLRRLDVALCALALVALVGQALTNLYMNPGYGTDEAAFEQAAAVLLLHGHNPYGANLSDALSQYRVPIQYATALLNGGTVSTFGYPSVPILVGSLGVLLTGGTQAVPISDVIVLMITTVGLFFMLPAHRRPVAILACVGLPILFGFAASGVNAIVCMALLSAAAYRWSSVGEAGVLTRTHRLQAVALGLAIATQQLSWFIAPFLLVGIFLLRRDSLGGRTAARLVGRYGTWSAGAFLTVNAPFMIWSFHSWFHSIAAPVTQHAIPYGQGLVDLTLFFHLGGGALQEFQTCAALLYGALLALYVLNFRSLARACFALPLIPFFYSSRSLAEYFMTLVAVLMISIVTVSSESVGLATPPPLPGRRKDKRRLLSALLFAPAAVLLASALTSPSPLALSITDMNTSGQLENIWKIDVRVHNRSNHSLSPHFATNSSGQASTFWNIERGPGSLAPHTTGHYVLLAPNVGSMPSITSALTLEAFTAAPATFSSTRAVTPSPYSASLMPSYEDHVIRASKSVTLTVQLRSPLGADVHKAGARVALGQLIYAQAGLMFAQATINRSPEGETPVYAKTNARGQAIFHVRDHSPQQNPIDFQAWLQPSGGYPFGYSELVSVVWR
jgi:hypothetical protein